MSDLIGIMRECQGSMTQAQFGRLLGVGQSSISMIYGGRRLPSRRVIQRLGTRFPERQQDIARALFFAPEHHDKEVAIPIAHNALPCARHR